MGGAYSKGIIVQERVQKKLTPRILEYFKTKVNQYFSKSYDTPIDKVSDSKIDEYLSSLINKIDTAADAAAADAATTAAAAAAAAAPGGAAAPDGAAATLSVVLKIIKTIAKLLSDKSQFSNNVNTIVTILTDSEKAAAAAAAAAGAPAAGAPAAGAPAAPAAGAPAGGPAGAPAAGAPAGGPAGAPAAPAAGAPPGAAPPPPPPSASKYVTDLIDKDPSLKSIISSPVLIDTKLTKFTTSLKKTAIDIQEKLKTPPVSAVSASPPKVVSREELNVLLEKAKKLPWKIPEVDALVKKTEERLEKERESSTFKSIATIARAAGVAGAPAAGAAGAPAAGAPAGGAPAAGAPAATFKTFINFKKLQEWITSNRSNKTATDIINISKTTAKGWLTQIKNIIEKSSDIDDTTKSSILVTSKSKDTEPKKLVGGARLSRRTRAIPERQSYRRPRSRETSTRKNHRPRKGE